MSYVGTYTDEYGVSVDVEVVDGEIVCTDTETGEKYD